MLALLCCQIRWWYPLWFLIHIQVGLAQFQVLAQTNETPVQQSPYTCARKTAVSPHGLLRVGVWKYSCCNYQDLDLPLSEIKRCCAKQRSSESEKGAFHKQIFNGIKEDAQCLRSAWVQHTALCLTASKASKTGNMRATGNLPLAFPLSISSSVLKDFFRAGLCSLVFTSPRRIFLLWVHPITLSGSGKMVRL